MKTTKNTSVLDNELRMAIQGSTPETVKLSDNLEIIAENIIEINSYDEGQCFLSINHLDNEYSLCLVKKEEQMANMNWVYEERISTETRLQHFLYEETLNDIFHITILKGLVLDRLRTLNKNCK